MAIWNIKIGDELTIYYSYPFSSAAERAKIYLSHCFVCDCSACAAPTTLSDTRRTGMAKAIEAVGQLGLGQPQMTIALVRQILATSKLEKLQVTCGAMCDIAVDVTAAFCDFEASRKWAELALATHLLEAGEGAEAESSRNYIKDPSSNPISRMGKRAENLGGP